MDEQRLVRALRNGPPFATRYVAVPLELDEEPVAGRAGGSGRLLMVVAATALLLVAALAGTALIGTILSDDRTVPPDGLATRSRPRCRHRSPPQFRGKARARGRPRPAPGGMRLADGGGTPRAANSGCTTLQAKPLVSS